MIKDYEEKRHRRGRRGRGSRKPGRLGRRVVWSDGPYRAVVYQTCGDDLVVVLHFFAGRVVGTFALPPGMVADLPPGVLEGWIVSFLTKGSVRPDGARVGVSPPADWARHQPALSEYMFAEHYPDGSLRSRATLTVMAGDARGIKIVLNDRQEGRSLWSTGEDFLAAIEALEVMLQAPDCPWRADRPGVGKWAKKSS